MARALLRQGVTSFLPTAPSLPEAELPRFAERVRAWIPDAPDDGAQPLGFNLEGPFLAPSRKGAHDPAVLRTPDELGVRGDRAAARRPAGHDDRAGAAGRPRADRAARRRSASWRRWATRPRRSTRRGPGYVAGGRSTTHLFNAMTRRRPPGAGPRRRRADRRRGLRRAHRRRAARPPVAVADRHPHQAGRPAAAGERRAAAGRHGRRAGDPGRGLGRDRAAGGARSRDRRRSRGR